MTLGLKFHPFVALTNQRWSVPFSSPLFSEWSKTRGAERRNTSTRSRPAGRVKAAIQRRNDRKIQNPGTHNSKFCEKLPFRFLVFSPFRGCSVECRSRISYQIPGVPIRSIPESFSDWIKVDMLQFCQNRESVSFGVRIGFFLSSVPRKFDRQNGRKRPW